MIIGIGHDLVDISRIAKILEAHGARFEARCFTQKERELAADRKDRAAYYAKRFAAKEALVKALGTGFRDGISFQDIEIISDSIGKPAMALSGAAQKKLNKCVSNDAHAFIHLSLTDEYPYASAYLVIEARGNIA